MPIPEDADREKLLEVGLAMLYLTMHGDKYETRAWKGLDWELTNALHERGWISDPQGKAKSVGLSDEGQRLAEKFFKKHFGGKPK